MTPGERVAATGRPDGGDDSVSRRRRRETGTAVRAVAVPDAPTVVTDRSLDRLFDALAHPARRRILAAVSERPPRGERSLSVADLATEDDDPERFGAELYHVHLPRLADAGYVEWDRDDRAIRRGPDFEEVAAFCRLLDGREERLP